MSSSTPAIGIDLGTTKSCVAVFRHGAVEVIADSVYNRLTPSVVAFTDNERLIGEAAVSQAGRNPVNTIFGRSDSRNMADVLFSNFSLYRCKTHGRSRF